MKKTKQFKAESKRLLDLMIHSIYSNKEIFLRELISNSSDAIDKYHFLSLQDEKLNKSVAHQIFITLNKEKKEISIEDTGIGMTSEEIEKNLGSIASSGSLEFAKKIEKSENKDEVNIIGQFGVGFYSAFIVAKKVEVLTKSPFSDKAYLFTSTGEDSYTIEESEKDSVGTKITLFLKDNAEEETYDEFLDQYTIKDLVKKYSDYIRYPIKMEVTNSKYKGEDKDKKPIYEDSTEVETLNSMVALWNRPKSKVTPEDLNNFYKDKFNDYTEPMVSLQLSLEGLISYNGIVFIPKKAPYDIYSENFEKGLQLYTKGVFIMDKCKDLIPNYLRFVRGVVDTLDLSLNISREMLQQNRQLIKIAQSVEKKIIAELERMLSNEREKYQEFFNEYGKHIKFGVYDMYGEKKDLLKDLLLFKSSNSDSLLTLKEYVAEMKENQDAIYYCAGKSKQAILAIPQMDVIKKQGFNVLILDEDIDEFAINILGEYSEKKFKSITSSDLDLLSKEEQEKIDELATSKKDLLDELKNYLKDEVNDVVLSKRLADSPVCLVSSEGLSINMEQVISKLPGSENNPKATKILEINPNHELFKTLEKTYTDDKESLKDYAIILLNQAKLIEGLSIENPVELSNLLSKLMIKSSK